MALALAGCAERSAARSFDASAEADAGTSSDPCTDVECLESLPAAIAEASTVDLARAGWDRYGCGPAVALDGHEAVYRVTLPEDGFLGVAKTPGAAPGHTVLRLLGSLDPGDCLDAHDARVGGRLPAGDYYVVVDSAAGEEGAYSLELALTTTASLEAAGIVHDLAVDALSVIGNAWAWGATRRLEYVVVDFTLHSSAEREWVFDLATGELLWHLRVAHGRGSTDGVDLARAVAFSNTSGSHQSSLGVFRSSGTYVGTYGPSFRLEGLEPGFNDQVCVRDIVMHPWAPVGDEYVARCGWARPSFGCPAIDSTLAMPVRDRLARPDGGAPDDGVIMLFWYPDAAWRPASSYVHGGTPEADVTALLPIRCDSSQDNTPTPPASGDYACD